MGITMNNQGTNSGRILSALISKLLEQAIYISGFLALHWLEAPKIKFNTALHNSKPKTTDSASSFDIGHRNLIEQHFIYMFRVLALESFSTMAFGLRIGIATRISRNSR